MNKLILLSAKSTGLTSLRRVSDDMLAGYRLIDPQAEVYYLEKDHTIAEIFWDLFKQSSPLNIVILHPEIYRSQFFIKLSSLLRTDDKLTIHLFGDLLRWADTFGIAASKLTAKQVTLITPSDSFRKHLQPFFSAQTKIHVVPFPVKVSGEIANSDEIRKFRQTLGVENKTMSLYTGRISRQKNILAMIDYLKKTKAEGSYKACFIGKIDEFEYTNVGRNNPPGWLYQQIEANRTDDMIFIDHLPENELRLYYQAADLYFSFSTYHDEDFGRAPVESLLYGTPVMLTTWGGFNDLHQNYPLSTVKVPLALSEDKLFIDAGKIEEANSPAKILPEKIGQLKNAFSFEKFIENIKRIQSETASFFTEMNEVFYQLALSKKQYFYLNQRVDIDRYFRIYQQFGQLIKTESLSELSLECEWFAEEEKDIRFYQIPKDQNEPVFYPEGKPEFFRLESLNQQPGDNLVLFMADLKPVVKVPAERYKKVYLLLTDQQLGTQSEILAQLPCQADIMTMQDVLWSSDLKSYDLLETGTDAGSFFAHLFLSKGGGLVQDPLTAEQKTKICKIQKLSRHHQMIIFSSRP